MTTELSPRERQILAGIRRGLMNKEIAYELHLGEGTVRQYSFSLFNKLGVSTRIQALIKSYAPVLETDIPPCGAD